jgi:hypothetical protein
MAERKWPLEIGEWNEVADEMGKFTPRQLRDRWMNHLRLPLDQSEFTIAERREAFKKALTCYGKWKNIAIHIGNSRTRSAAMIKKLVTRLTVKLRGLGFILTHEADVALLPDVLFEWGRQPQDELQVILDQFKHQKELKNRQVLPFPCTIWSLLNDGRSPETLVALPSQPHREPHGLSKAQKAPLGTFIAGFKSYLPI